MNRQFQPDDVEVTVLLDGGHQHSIVLPPNDPLLGRLFEVLLSTGEDCADEVFQLPINRGRSTLCFRGDRLVGLITDPPVTLQPDSEQESPINPSIFPSEFIQLDNFLTSSEHRRLLDYTIKRKPAFVPTTTSTGAANYRESVVLHEFPEFSDLITKKVRDVTPEILDKLSIPGFEITQVEAQLTAHNDDNFYKVHNDNGSPVTATRELTYVYYFYREPKAFSGGELRIYDTTIRDNYYVEAETYHTIEPRNNSIVFFPSRYMHEVLPIRCPSRDFSDSRFTINGWIRR